MLAADAGSLNRRRAELLEHQRGAQHRDSITGLRIRRQYGGTRIGAPRHHQAGFRQAQLCGHRWGQMAQRCSRRPQIWQGPTPGLVGDCSQPAPFRLIPAQAEIVGLLAPAPIRQQPTAEPIGLMPQQHRRATRPMARDQGQGAGQTATGASRRPIAAFRTHQIRCRLGLLWNGVVVGQSLPQGTAIRLREQQGARRAINGYSRHRRSPLLRQLPAEADHPLLPAEGVDKGPRIVGGELKQQFARAPQQRKPQPTGAQVKTQAQGLEAAREGRAQTATRPAVACFKLPAIASTFSQGRLRSLRPKWP